MFILFGDEYTRWGLNGWAVQRKSSIQRWTLNKFKILWHISLQEEHMFPQRETYGGGGRLLETGAYCGLCEIMITFFSIWLLLSWHTIVCGVVRKNQSLVAFDRYRKLLRDPGRLVLYNSSVELLPSRTRVSWETVTNSREKSVD